MDTTAVAHMGVFSGGGLAPPSQTAVSDSMGNQDWRIAGGGALPRDVLIYTPYLMSSVTRREFLAATAAVPAALSAAPKRPNILFIMVDEMRWDAMGCEKHPVVETPNLDKLAAQGVRFANSYTVSPVCSPARACVFTGRHAHVNGVTTNGVPANEGEIFLPTILKHHGYQTAIAGKLHYTPRRFDYGFDQFWTFSTEGPTPEIGYVEYLKKTHGSPAKWPIVPGTCPWPDDPLGRDVGLFKYKREDFETEWITDRSIDYLRSRKSNPQQPWFLFTSYLKPHSPSVEPQPWFGKYDPAAMPIPKLPPNARETRAAQQGRSKRHYVDNEQMVRVMTALYYAAISHVDQQVGRILTELDRLGMADDTLVLFTADHGNMLGDRGRWFKGLQYDGSARVPLLWRSPKGSRRNGGRVIEEVIENTDLMPTIFDAAAIPVPERVQGRSFLKLVSGPDSTWKNRCYSQLRSGMYLQDGFKLIDNSLDGAGGSYELYDLRNDPQEQRNLAGEAKSRDRVQAYLKNIREWRADQPPPVTITGLSTPAYASISSEERQRAIQTAPDNVEAAKRGAEKPRRARVRQ
jgi:arylsulfatase A-like enzyme